MTNIEGYSEWYKTASRLLHYPANETETLKLTEISFRAIIYLYIFYVIPSERKNRIN